MSNSALENASRPVRPRDFYLGRQPVIDRQQALFGYELLFRNALNGPIDVVSGLSTTATVIANMAQLGLDKVMGDAHGFVPVDADVLASDIFAFLPRERVILQLAGTVQATDAVLARMAQLANHGYRFCAAGIAADTPNVQRLLPLVDYVKLDLNDMPQATLARLAPLWRSAGKKLVAEKVETREAYQMCMDLGFDYFQGFHFARPAVIGGRKLSPSQMAVLDLMKMVTSDAESIDIERAVKKDPSLALNLLRLVNTPAAGARKRIDSIGQALLLLGRRQLQRWLQILLYADPSSRGHTMSPLLMLATTRGRLMELLAQRLRPGQRNLADIAFTVGIMSLMDVLFEVRMDDLMEQIPMIDEVSDALLHRTGFFGELLRLAESIERMDDAAVEVAPCLETLSITSDDLLELEVAAFEWTDSVVRYAI
ncbi:MAG: EAL domain-containing protein [Pseudomonadota bacterium]|nr:EAL domain-containing protein [Pseudomonadota bacterium]